MTTLYTNQSTNVKKTWFLMTSFLVLIIAIGFGLSFTYGNPYFLYIAIGISLITNIGAYWFSDKLVLQMAGAKKIESKDDYPELWNTMENLCITAGLPMPKLYVIDDPAPNAFATGRDKNHSVVAVTSGLLPLLTKSELEGVLAHELSHIGNKDMLIQTVVVVFAGMISIIANIALHISSVGGNEKKNPFLVILGFVGILLAPIVATIIKLAISREREFLADATGALITRYPEGLASALEKISNFHQPMRIQNNTIAHLFISDPTGINDETEVREHEKVSFVQKLFMTHPPVKERVARLLVK
ncbi:MAG: M48 family metalloprotease [Candidatus Pacebacteria bacterium]|nr:M48 family metalloprotease [Candidatus Paceibacterota bacterium]MBP9866513.1 M48 family metalloprotease [Candidatus Paceibacterota bacterium]